MNTFTSIKTCASNLNIPEITLSAKLNTGATILIEGKPHYVKRVATLPDS